MRGSSLILSSFLTKLKKYDIIFIEDKKRGKENDGRTED